MVASWRTPSWEDVNIELMNRYYTKMSDNTRQVLSKIRGAHNLWYVYSNKSNISEAIKSSLVQRVEQEKKSLQERYDFEDVLDDCGFRYLERWKALPLMNSCGGSGSFVDFIVATTLPTRTFSS